LVLDEPTSYLDMRYKLEVLAVLQRMAREHQLTVMMSLHELELAERISDKIVCIKGNGIHRYGTPEEIFTPGYVELLYDMQIGSYDVLSGRPELPGAEGKPRVFVIAGGGSGTSTFRRLQRQGVPFAAGILWENDLDYPVAGSLAAEVVSQKAFTAVGQETFERALELLQSCEEVICCMDEFGEWNQANRALLERAQAMGKLKQACAQRDAQK
jgi:iron complex transport system ATP-binding protein